MILLKTSIRISIFWILITGIALFADNQGSQKDIEKGWAELNILPIDDIDEGISLQIIIQGPMQIPTDALNINTSLREFLTLSVDGKIMGWIGDGNGKGSAPIDSVFKVPAGCRIIVNLPIKEHEIYLKSDSFLDKSIRVTHSAFAGSEGFFKITKQNKVIPID
jgi:hypothetical protein